MEGTCFVRNVRPGDTIHWSCGYEDCGFVYDEDVTEFNAAPGWPDRLIEHIWREGHLRISSSGQYERKLAPAHTEEFQHVPYIIVGTVAFVAGLFAGVVIW
jgi:hypothetical protein